MMTSNNIPLAQELDRVPSSIVPLNAQEGSRRRIGARGADSGVGLFD